MISVIVPIYNVADYLNDSIQSILNSTYKDLEVILVDDGSTDNCGSLCDEYAAADARCKVFHTKNGGLSAARNYGMEHASGDFIAFVDGDDFIHPQMFEVLYNALYENPSADFSFCHFTTYHVGDSKHHEVIDYPTVQKHEIGKSMMVNSMFGTWKKNGVIYIVAWNKLYRRRFIQEIKFTECPISEDLIFNTEVSIRMNQAVLVDAPLYYYVQRSGSIIHQGITKKYIDQIDVYDRCYELFKVERPDLRNVCLQKCLKKNLNIICEARNTDLYGYAKDHSKAYLNKYRRDLFYSTYPFLKKMSLIIMSYFPHLYQRMAVGFTSFISGITSNDTKLV